MDGFSERTLSDRAVELVAALAAGNIDVLKPEFDMGSKLGYSYPEAVGVLGVERGTEVEVLRKLAERGLLDCEPVAEVPVCPFCQSFALHVERHCPACDSKRVRRTTMIHHFRCGNVSVEESYRQESELVCPKCAKTLRHIGVDYERPSEVWLCEQCGEASAEPALRYRSLECGRAVPIDDVLDKTLYSYKLSTNGRMMANERTIRAAVEGPEETDPLTGLPGVGALRRQIDLENDRAERYKTIFSVVRVTLENGEELEEKFGEQALGRIVRTMATVAHENLRSVDLLGRVGRFTLMAVLPETDAEGAVVVENKLVKELDRYLHTDDRDELSCATRFKADTVDMRRQLGRGGEVTDAA